MNCPICKESQSNIVLHSHDDRYGYPGQFPLLRCQLCGHEYLDCVLSSAQLSDLYTNYYPRKSLEIEKYKIHAERNGISAWFNGLGSSAFRWVPRNVRVLDVGCGFGQSLGYHINRGCDVYGVEADENIRRVVEKFGYRVHVGLFDASLYEANFFDYVTLDQVVEHVADPLLTLQGVAMILKHGGTAVLSTPNSKGWGALLFGRRWINWHSPYHLQFFTRRSMRLAAQHAGLILTEVKTVTNSEWLLYQWIHLVAYPKSDEPSYFWSPNKSGESLFQKILVRLILGVHKMKINHLITRVFDGLKLGDNFIFILRKP